LVLFTLLGGNRQPPTRVTVKLGPQKKQQHDGKATRTITRHGDVAQSLVVFDQSVLEASGQGQELTAQHLDRALRVLHLE